MYTDHEGSMNFALKIKVHPITSWGEPVLSVPLVISSPRVDTEIFQLHVVDTGPVKMEFELQLRPGFEFIAVGIAFKPIILSSTSVPTVARKVQFSRLASLLGSPVLQFQAHHSAICPGLKFVGNSCSDARNLRTTWS